MSVLLTLKIIWEPRQGPVSTLVKIHQFNKDDTGPCLNSQINFSVSFHSHLLRLHRYMSEYAPKDQPHKAHLQQLLLCCLVWGLGVGLTVSGVGGGAGVGPHIARIAIQHRPCFKHMLNEQQQQQLWPVGVCAACVNVI